MHTCLSRFDTCSVKPQGAHTNCVTVCSIYGNTNTFILTWNIMKNIYIQVQNKRRPCVSFTLSSTPFRFQRLPCVCIDCLLLSNRLRFRFHVLAVTPIHSHQLSKVFKGLTHSPALSSTLLRFHYVWAWPHQYFRQFFPISCLWKFSELFSTFSPFYLKLTDNNSTHQTWKQRSFYLVKLMELKMKQRIDCFLRTYFVFATATVLVFWDPGVTRNSRYNYVKIFQFQNK